MTDQENILREIKREILRVDTEISALQSTIEKLTPDERMLAVRRATALHKWHKWALTDDELCDAQDAHAAVAIPLGEARFELEKILDERQSLIERRDKISREAD